jgi:glycosyltransferase involved in cell wall biosynthesis
MAKKISVIVCVYNGQDYLAKCLQSLADQNFGIENLEILLMNDGSKDLSLEILKNFQKKYPDSARVVDSRNQGLAKTRNKALGLATSKYVIYVDQDDWIDSDYCQKMFDAIDRDNLDVIACGMRRTDGQKIYYTRPTDSTAWYRYRHVETWAKIYRVAFLRQIKAQSFSNIFGDDMPFSINIYSANPKFKTIKYVGYNWFLNNQSITSTVHKNFDKIQLDKLLKELNKYNKSEIIQYYLINVAVYGLLHSNLSSDKKTLAANVRKTFGSLAKLDSKIFDNRYIKNRIDGIESKNYFAIKLFVRAYQTNNFGLCFCLYLLTKPLLERK